MREAVDYADALVDAASLARADGMTRDQFLGAAGVFWDAWVEVERVTGKSRNPDDKRGKENDLRGSP